MMSKSNPRALALEILWKVETRDAYSHILLNHLLQKHRLEVRDKSLVTRLVYGVLTWKRRLEAELDLVLRKRTHPYIYLILKLGLYQIRHMDKIPDHAIVNECVELAKSKGKSMAGLVNGVLKRLIKNPPAFPPPKVDSITAFGLQYSLNDEWAERALRQWQDQADLWGDAINRIPPLTLHIFCSKVSLSKVEAFLKDQGISYRKSQWASCSLEFEQWSKALEEILNRDWAMVQDQGSQLLVQWGEIQNQSPSRAWDMCAGQGGKSLNLADLARQGLFKGKLISSDLHAQKLKRYWRDLQRLHPSLSKVWKIQAGDARSMGFKDHFDWILLDAPCSGMGLIRRHPETRWRRKVKDIEALAEIQRQLLDTASKALKTQGLLVYGVCTDTPEETELQIQAFLERHPEFNIALPQAPELRTLADSRGYMKLAPHIHNTDGFFGVCLRKQ